MGSRTEQLRIRALKVALAIAFLVTATSAPTNVVRAAEGDDLVNQGMTQNTNGNYPAAINAFERYLQLYPNGASVNQAHLYAGHAYMLQNKYITNAEASSAQNHFNAILRQGPSARFFKEALFHTAHLAYEMRNYADSKSRFEEFLRQYPNDGFNVYVYYYLANCEKQLGNNRNAIAYYEQALSKDPTSALNWNCRLEHASLVGKTGDYNAAERELATLAATPNLPADIAGQVAVQRALLQIVQQKYDNAIEILERYVSTYKSYDDSVATDAMAAVYLHEAYAYTAKRQFQQALNVIERNLERNKNTLVPEAALLKIKLLLALRRNSDAAALLDSFRTSAFGRDNPDLVTSYQAMLDLTNGKYDQVIDTLTRLLQVRLVSGTSNNYGSGYRTGYGANSGTDYRSYYGPDYSSGTPDYSSGTYRSAYNSDVRAEIGYFAKTGGQNLEPLECVEACGTLILAYASRFAATENMDDSYAQEAIFDETTNYVNWLNDPVVNLIRMGIDKRRKDALTKPISNAEDSFYVVTPYATNDYSSTPGQFSDPTNYRNYNRPGYYMDGSAVSEYRPRDYYTSDEYRWGNQREQRRYDSNDPSGYDTPTNSRSQYNNVPNGTAPRNADPRYPGDAGYNASGANNANGAAANPNNANGAASNPNNAGAANNANGAASNPNNAGAANNANGATANPNNAGGSSQAAAAQYGPDGRPINPVDAQGATNAQNDRYPGDAANAQADEEERKITPTEAKETLDKAQNFFVNQEFDRCNETLLELLTTSESFWKDCPEVAPKVAYLRADALTHLGKRSEAQMSYQDVIDNAPYSTEAPLAAANIGFAYDDLGRTEDATEYLRRATAGGVVTPLTDKALYLLGMNEKERGNIQGAKQAFARVYRDFSSSPYWSHATWALAALESASGSDVEAEKLVNEALRNGPDVAIIDYLLFLKGEIALRAKDYTKALIAFDMIVEQYPDSSLYSRAINRLAAIPEKYRNNFDFEEVFEEEVPRRPQVPARAPQTTRSGGLSSAGQTAAPARPAPDDPAALPPRRSLDDLRRSAQESTTRTSTPSTSRTTPTGAPNPSSTGATSTRNTTGSSTTNSSTNKTTPSSTGTSTSSSTKK